MKCLVYIEYYKGRNKLTVNKKKSEIFSVRSFLTLFYLSNCLLSISVEVRSPPTETNFLAFALSQYKTKKGFQLVEALLIVIKTYGLAIDREVSFIMSPSSDKAMDNVFSSSIVKLAGLPLTALPLIR